MADIRIRRRRRLRSKDVKAISKALEEELGVEALKGDVDRGEGPEFDVFFEDGDIVAMIVDERPFLTVRGLLKYRPERRAVTVDMGAVPYVTNGADVMAPGIVGATDDIAEGDLIWVRDSRNGVPLAVCKALMDGRSMVEGRKGKAASMLHHVGDRLWTYGED